MITDNNDAVQKEFEEAAVEAKADVSPDAYTHRFKKPLKYNNKTYDMLTFDFARLTGKDSLAIEAELQALGVMVMVPTFSGPYLVRIIARACTTPIGIDAIEQMGIADYNKLRSKARNFMLDAEQ